MKIFQNLFCELSVFFFFVCFIQIKIIMNENFFGALCINGFWFLCDTSHFIKLSFDTFSATKVYRSFACFNSLRNNFVCILNKFVCNFYFVRRFGINHNCQTLIRISVAILCNHTTLRTFIFVDMCKEFFKRPNAIFTARRNNLFSHHNTIRTWNTKSFSFFFAKFLWSCSNTHKIRFSYVFFW